METNKEVKDLINKYWFTQEKVWEIFWITRQTVSKISRNNKFNEYHKALLNRYLQENSKEDILLIDLVSKNPTMNLVEMERFLEFLQDHRCLNDNWDNLKNKLLDIIYKKQWN